MAGIKLCALIRTVALATVVTAAASPASAAIYHSDYDPLGLFGTADFFVSSGCLSSDGFKPNDGITCDVSWLDARVTLTDLPSLATRTFDYSGFLPSMISVTGVDIVSGNLAGVVSSPIGPVLLGGSPDPAFNGSFAMEFSHSEVDLIRNGSLAATAQAIFFPVPEPDSVNLILAALGVGWLARGRRRKGTREAP